MPPGSRRDAGGRHDRGAGELTLFTFARNRLARRFYERRGFECIAHGFEPHWQLEDVQYRWRRDSFTAAGSRGLIAAR